MSNTHLNVTRVMNVTVHDTGRPFFGSNIEKLSKSYTISTTTLKNNYSKECYYYYLIKIFLIKKNHRSVAYD